MNDIKAIKDGTYVDEEELIDTERSNSNKINYNNDNSQELLSPLLDKKTFYNTFNESKQEV